MIFLFGTLLISMALVLKAPIYALGAGVALLFYCAVLKRDLYLIQSGINELVDSKRVSLPQAGRAFSSLGGGILENLFSISFRLEALDSTQVVPPTTKEVLRREVRVDDFVLDEFFGEILTFIDSKFRCNSSAILFQPSPVADWKVSCRGIGGDRFVSKMTQIVNALSARHYRPEDFRGVRDGYEEGSIINELSLFGIRYSLFLPFSEHSNVGRSGFLWLGYDERKYPTNAEVESAQTVSEFITLQLTTKSKVSNLHRELGKMRSDNNRKTQFFADLSHDVRTPLNNVKNILTLIKFEETNSDIHKMLESALDNCDHMADIVEDILFYSQYQVGELKADVRSIPLVAALGRIVSAFQASARLKGLELMFNPPPECEEMNALVDSKHLRRMVSNLLSNAIKYTSKGQVVVTLNDRSPGTLSIVVSDSGTGLSAAEISKLFTPFTRFDRTRVEGVGLGLALSKILAHLNGGDITVKSVLGEGSKFELRLSRAYESTRLERGSHHVGTQVESGEREVLWQILLVDDDADYLHSMSRLLKRGVKEVLIASNGIEAVGVLQFERPDLIITDGSMPNGGAELVIAEAKKLGIPVVVVTGRDELEPHFRLLHGGITFLKKPVDPDMLLSKVAELLTGSGTTASYSANG